MHTEIDGLGETFLHFLDDGLRVSSYISDYLFVWRLKDLSCEPKCSTVKIKFC